MPVLRIIQRSLTSRFADQAFECGVILDLVLGLAEHQSQRAVLFAEVLQWSPSGTGES